MKINIREELNRIDKETYNEYDLVNMYDSQNVSIDKKKTIAKKLNEGAPAKELYAILDGKIVSEKKKINEEFGESLNEDSYDPKDIKEYSMIHYTDIFQLGDRLDEFTPDEDIRYWEKIRRILKLKRIDDIVIYPDQGEYNPEYYYDEAKVEKAKQVIDKQGTIKYTFDDIDVIIDPITGHLYFENEDEAISYLNMVDAANNGDIQESLNEAKFGTYLKGMAKGIGQIAAQKLGVTDVVNSFKAMKAELDGIEDKDLEKKKNDYVAKLKALKVKPIKVTKRGKLLQDSGVNDNDINKLADATKLNCKVVNEVGKMDKQILNGQITELGFIGFKKENNNTVYVYYDPKNKIIFKSAMLLFGSKPEDEVDKLFLARQSKDSKQADQGTQGTQQQTMPDSLSIR